MNEFQTVLYTNLMALCSDPEQEAFYFVDQKKDDKLYRIFLYRLASYTEFLKPGATECRGHTFEIDASGNALRLASMAMQKFFNHGENPFVMGLDLSKIDHIMDKLDGSLISTVSDGDGDFFLKSKGSFGSDQAQAATMLLATEKYAPLHFGCKLLALTGYTVNMEYMSPDNRIVIGYMEPTLKILNVRYNMDGSYVPLDALVSHDSLQMGIPPEFIVQSHPIPEDGEAWVASVAKMLEDIEGYVVRIGDLWFKLKTEKYAALHKTKDSITIPRRLFETCVTGGADDLRGMFASDPVAVMQIDEMQEKVAKIYNHLHAYVHAFYKANKDADRKTYALAGQADQTLMKDGTFSLAMNLYLGRDANIEDFMVKNYKKYGIKDEADLPVGVEE
jgi:RNA ligase